MSDRRELRHRLLADRLAFVASHAAVDASRSLARRLADVIVALEPQSLGIYAPMRAEFNVKEALGADARIAKTPLALPFARRSPASMAYRAWDGTPPRHVDECGIAASDGAPVTPDVVVVPCLGFTRSGWRLGYGGGYFDRWLAANPHVTAVGVAWSIGRIDDAAFEPQAHDRALPLIVTEHGIDGDASLEPVAQRG